MALSLKVGTTSRLVLNDLQDADSVAITDATVQAWLYDKYGNEVGDSTFPITLTHQSSGTYYGTIDAAIDVSSGQIYEVVITAISSGITGKWSDKVYVEKADGV